MITQSGFGLGFKMLEANFHCPIEYRSFLFDQIHNRMDDFQWKEVCRIVVEKHHARPPLAVYLEIFKEKFPFRDSGARDPGQQLPARAFFDHEYPPHEPERLHGLKVYLEKNFDITLPADGDPKLREECFQASGFIAKELRR